jgi:hypothetical protein
MGRGTDDKIFRPAGNTPPVDPALLARPDVRAALTGHDIGALFRVLNENGWSQAGQAQELWQPTAADPNGDLDYVAACLELDRGRLDAAQPLAAASARRWESASRRPRTQADILLATIHVQAGEPDGLRLAHGVIIGVSKLSSFRARQRLGPLATALESRPRNDHHELARMARQVATTRA